MSAQKHRGRVARRARRQEPQIELFLREKRGTQITEERCRSAIERNRPPVLLHRRAELLFFVEHHAQVVVGIRELLVGLDRLIDDFFASR